MTQSHLEQKLFLTCGSRGRVHNGRGSSVPKSWSRKLRDQVFSTNRRRGSIREALNSQSSPPVMDFCRQVCTTSPNSATYREQVQGQHFSFKPLQDLSGTKERLDEFIPTRYSSFRKKKKLEKLGSSGLILVGVSVINKTLSRNILGDKGHVWLMGYGLSCREIRAGVQGGNLEQRTWRKCCRKATVLACSDFFLIEARTSSPGVSLRMHSGLAPPSHNSHQFRKFPHRTCL